MVEAVQENPLESRIKRQIILKHYRKEKKYRESVQKLVPVRETWKTDMRALFKVLQDEGTNKHLRPTCESLLKWGGIPGKDPGEHHEH